MGFSSSSETSSDENHNQRPSQASVISLVVIISLTRIGHGLFMSLSGPTLLYLVDNVNGTVSQVSAMFTGRSAGFFVGTILFGLVKKRWPKYKPLTTIAVQIVIAGVLVLIVPWLTNLALLIVDTTIIGLMFGFFDAGLQSIYLQLWGEKGSRPYLQSFHFFFGVGAFLAPIISAPFLEMADQVSDDDTCPGTVDGVSVTTVSYNDTSSPTSPSPYEGLNPVSWTYIISGAYTIVIGVIMFVSAVLRIEDKIKTNHEASAESRREEPIRDVVWLFIPIMIYYFMAASVETVYQSYIYSIALCSGLQFSIRDATTLNTLFWIGFMVGRGSGIFYAKYFTPKTIIIFDLITTTLALIIMSIFGSYIAIVPWAVSIFYGLTVATLYSSGISWTSNVTNVSSTYILIFGAGNTVGVMTMSPLAGALFDMSPFNVIYHILAMSICNDLVFLWMMWIGRRHVKKLNISESKLNLAEDSEKNLKTRL
ncbi:sodium-dependent glucose transporter 1A-like [Clavelina lepadiformis]|uniref:sodium-dependent glucose transporter 1A-like n=1 Tax=Clavelina lepadiformis TaxID=159417 RepID=UPI004042D814